MSSNFDCSFCRFVPEEVGDCAIADLMSLPLDSLCQLAWPLINPQPPVSHGAAEIPSIPRLSRTEADYAHLARTINTFVEEMISVLRARCWPGQLTCHTLRSALFSRALQSVHHRYRGKCPKTCPLPRRMWGCVSPGDLGETATGGRRFAELGFFVDYVEGQGGEQCFTQGLRKLVGTAAGTAQNKAHKQVVYIAVASSACASKNKRNAKAFLYILREVLERWNAISDTTGGASVFAFSVVVPLLNITRCTILNDADAVAVAQLLSTVCPPASGAGEATPSTVNFVTRYKLSLSNGGEEKSVPQSNLCEYTSTSAGTPASLPVVSPLSPSPVLTTLLHENSGDQTSGDVVDTITSTGTEKSGAVRTEHFLSAPNARKVSVHVRRAIGCNGFQILLIPCTATVDDPHMSSPKGTPSHNSNTRSSAAANTSSSASSGLYPMDPVCFEPRDGVRRQLCVGCDAVLRRPRDAVRAELEAEICVERRVALDSHWASEFRCALSAAQRHAAEGLLQRVRGALPPPPREEALALLRRGFVRKPPGARIPFVASLAAMDDAALRRAVPCRKADAHGVRAALILAAALHGEDEEVGEAAAKPLTWKSRVWQETARRVSLSSTSLGLNPRAMELATFAADHVAPCRLIMPQIVGGVIALVADGHSAADLRALFAAQKKRAQLGELALSLLLCATNNFAPENMFRVACLLREALLVCEGGHYLQRFQGCGVRQESAIRVAMHRLFAAVFKALCDAVVRTGGKAKHPHCFMWDPDAFGPFAVVCLSILTTPLNGEDMRVLWRHMSILVMDLLPDFTDFSRVSVFCVKNVEESYVLDSLRAFIRYDTYPTSDSAAYVNYEAEGSGAAVAPGAETGTAPVNPTVFGALERITGVWEPTGKERICYSTLPMYAPSTSSATSLHALDVQMLRPPQPEVFIAVTNKALSTVTMESAGEDSDGFYFFPHYGTLLHGERSVRFAPLALGDVLTLCFTLSPDTPARAFCLFLNGVRLAKLPAPAQKLFFFAGAMDAVSLQANGFSMVFRPHKEISSSIAALPTRYGIAMFVTLMFYYFVSLCSRRLAQACRSSGVGSGYLQPSLLPVAVNSRKMNAKHDSEENNNRNSNSSSANNVTTCHDTTGDFAKELWNDFLMNCYAMLEGNVGRLIDSLQLLSVLSESIGGTEGVKHSVASFVYHRFLMDYTTIIRTAMRSSPASVYLLETLARIVGCDAVDDHERCHVLTTACSALRDPIHRTCDLYDFNPISLWECCRVLARDVFAHAYRPVFSPESVAPDCGVFAGGRRIKTPQLARKMHATTSFASRGICMDGSMGDTVSFSVRLQRGMSWETLGRFYYVGVSCPFPNSRDAVLTQHAGNREDLTYVYAITDHFTDVSSPSAQAELPRYSRNWMSSAEGMIFGSGDVITVIVQTQRRCVDFERNGLPLGTLYVDLPPAVEVLFPFVELFNRDAGAVWIHPSREIGIRARCVMREIILERRRIFLLRLRWMLAATGGTKKDGVDTALALAVLGADGDELSFSYRHPPRSEEKGSCEVRLVRMTDTRAKVVFDAAAAIPRGVVVCAAALERTYDITISNQIPTAFFAEDLMRIAGNALSFTVDSVRIHPVPAFLRALRLLSEMDVDGLSVRTEPARRGFLKRIVRLLSLPDAVVSDASRVVVEAWNELSLLSNNAELVIPTPPSAKPTGASASCGEVAPDVVVRSPPSLAAAASSSSSLLYSLSPYFDSPPSAVSPSSSVSSAAGRPLPCLRCPACDEPWGSCTHPAPWSRSVILHSVLLRIGRESPYTGFAGEWVLSDEGFSVTLCVSGNEVSGDGEERRGRFHFASRSVSDGRVTGCCVFACADPPIEIRAIDEEWVCDACTFINSLDSTRCSMCTTARPGATWSCVICTYAFNSNNSNICTTCGNQRLGAKARDAAANINHAFCEDCGEQREYHSFETFESLASCHRCARKTRWAPEKKHTAAVQATLVADGDRMEWIVTFGGTRCEYTGISNAGYNFDAMRLEAETASPAAAEFSRYVMPMMCTPLPSPSDAAAGNPSVEDHHQHEMETEDEDEDEDNEENEYETTSATNLTTTTTTTTTTAVASSMATGATGITTVEVGSGELPLSPRQRSSAALVPAILFFCSRLVCRWGPSLVPALFTDAGVLRRLRVLDGECLLGLGKMPLGVARCVLGVCLDILFFGNPNAMMISYIPAIARAVMNTKEELRGQRNYLLYALCLNAVRNRHVESVRKACLTALNALLEECCGEPLAMQCVRDVVTASPVTVEQQQLMLHASLRGIDVPMSPCVNVTATSWLIQVVDRMERQARLAALFDEQSPDIFPYLVKLPDTRMSESGELIVGQVRGSVGAPVNKGGKYYYEIVLPPNHTDWEKTTIMGWGTLQHEVLSSGHHVGSDIHSWGFNCDDRLRMLTGEQTIAIPRTIVGGDVVGAMLDLDLMMMAWSVNGEDLIWVPISLQGRGESIYPFVSAAVDPFGVVVRLGDTQFRPDGYQDFSFISNEEARRESNVAPRSYEFYAQLCAMGNDIVNCGYTVDSIIDTTAWFGRARALLAQYPLLHRGADGLDTTKRNDRDHHCFGVKEKGGEKVVVKKGTHSSDCTGNEEREYLETKEDTQPKQRAHRKRIVLAKEENVNESDVNKKGNVPPSVPESLRDALEWLRPYFQHLRSINALAVSVAKNHDFFKGSPYLFGLYQKVRQLLFFPARWAIVEQQIDRQLVPSDARRQREVVIDLNRSKAVAENSTLDFITGFEGSVTGQLFYQTRDAEIYVDTLMFVVRLAGEVAEDAGGVTRTVVSMMCDELSYRDDNDDHRAAPLLPFFKVNVHSTIVSLVPNMEFYSSHPEHHGLFLQLFTWLGKLMGNATLSGYLIFSLPLPRLVWKFLTFDESTIEDYYADVDDSARGVLSDDDFLLNDDFFYTLPGAAPQEESVVDAVAMTESCEPLGSSRSVPRGGAPAEAQRRRRLAERRLTQQYDTLLGAMRAGLTSVIPVHSLRLIRWDDLQQRLCGAPGATAEDVLLSLDMSLLTKDMQRMLTNVIRDFSQAQRSKFLLFCSGQRRIPLPERVQVSCGDDPQVIPTAHTCSPISLLLQPYPSAEILREKLEICLLHMYEFGFA